MATCILQVDGLSTGPPGRGITKYLITHPKSPSQNGPTIICFISIMFLLLHQEESTRINFLLTNFNQKKINLISH